MSEWMSERDVNTGESFDVCVVGRLSECMSDRASGGAVSDRVGG
jgi:hypothetical protein